MAFRRMLRCLRRTETVFIDRSCRSRPFNIRYARSITCYPRVHQSTVLLLPTKHARVGIAIVNFSSQLRLSSSSSSNNALQQHHQLDHNATLESRVSHLEQITSHRRLNKHDVHNEIWPLLSECAASDPSDSIDRCIDKAKLANRLIQLCLSEVDEYRVHIWRWIEEGNDNSTSKTNEQFQLSAQNQSVDDDSTENNGTILNQMYNLVFSSKNNNLPKSNDINNNEDNQTIHNFSPSTLWKNAPHPSKQMYNLAFSSWKRVIETSPTRHSSLSFNTIQITEKSARQVSSLLSTMENDYTADVEFVNAYNTTVDNSRYAKLRIGAACPDVTTYGEVMNVWGQCVGMFHRNRGKSRRINNNQKQQLVDNDGSLQYMMRLEATAMKEIMGLKESMEVDFNKPPEDGADTDENIDTVATTRHRIRRPSLDKPCFNIILATMARQINPSLAEMRLVIQQMMERVMHDLEHSDIELDDEDNPDEHPSMECFPDVVSYNSLIEARASRSSMFASDTPLRMGNRESNDAFQSIIIPHHKWSRGIAGKQSWRQDDESKLSSSSSTPRKLTASEEEAVFAEQILDEMCNLATLPVRPNIWSYNCKCYACIDLQWRHLTLKLMKNNVLLLYSSSIQL